MAVLETMLLRIGTTIATVGGKALIAGRKSDAERSMSLLELSNARGVGFLPQRRLNRQLEQLAEVIADRLKPSVDSEPTKMPENERAAALLGVAETLEKANLSDDLLFANDFNEGKLLLAIQSSARETLATYRLSEPAEQLYHLVLRESISHLAEVIVTLPSFQQRTLVKLLARESEVIDLLRDVLNRMPQRDARQGSGPGAQFKLEYDRELARKFDQVEIFGVTLSGPSRRYPLSVAYIGLSLTDNQASRQQETDELEIGAETIISTTNRIYIRGEAGSGKTTLLRWLALKSAQSTHEDPLASWNRKTPFLIELRRFAERDLPAPSEFLSGLSKSLAERMPPFWIDRILKSGRGALLIDGVDEFPADKRVELKNWIADLTSDYPEANFVVTSRPAATQDGWLDDLQFRRSSLLPMSKSYIISFVKHWHEAVALGAVEHSDLAKVEQYRRSLLAAIDRSRPLRLVATNPLLCALLCALNWDRRTQLPSRRIEIYRTALEMLLKRRDHERKVSQNIDIELEFDDRLAILQDLAYWFTLNEFADADVDRVKSKIRAILDSMPHVKVTSDQIYQYLLSRSGVLREPSPGRVDFIHKTFQEYLAAARFVEDDAIEVLVRNAHRDSYQEVIVMAAGCARPKEAERLVSDILDIVDKPRMAETKRARLRLLAVACVEVTTKISREVFDRVLAHLKKLAPPENFTWARILASLGEDVLSVLNGNSQGLTPSQAAATIRTAALVGGQSSLQLIGSFKDDARAQVVRERVRAWGFFDPIIYAHTAFGDPGAKGWHIRVADPLILPGIEHVLNLRDLRCHFSGETSPSDLSMLAENSALHSLTLERNPFVRNLDFLGGNDSLRELKIRECERLRNFDALLELNQLAHLEISRCLGQVDSDTLYTLKKLRTLQIDSHAPGALDRILNRLPKLTRLDLRISSGVTSISQLGFSTTLTSLSLADCPGLQKVAGLDRLPLRSLTLASCGTLESFVGIRDAANLRTLRISDIVHITDFEFLRNLTQLESLHLEGCGIEGLAILTEAPRLRDLTLINCASISDSPSGLGALKELSNLQTLRINCLDKILGPDADLFIDQMQSLGVSVIEGGRRERKFAGSDWWEDEPSQDELTSLEEFDGPDESDW